MLVEYTGKLPAQAPVASAGVSVLASGRPGRALRERDWVYLPDAGLIQAVNIALLLEQPLLLTGEPGTGKTQLAYSVATELNLGTVQRFDTKSTSSFRDLFYQFDSLRSFRDAQNHTPGVSNLDYITFNALGEAILRANASIAGQYLKGVVHDGNATRSVVLIDEVDKAPRDFPNDILREIDQMCFDVPEINARFHAEPEFRPVVIITSNTERQLPSAFLRRCVYYHIPFPEPEKLKEIVSERLGEEYPKNGKLLEDAVGLFYHLRSDTLNLKKKPSTAELLGWIIALQHKLRSPQASLKLNDAFVADSLSCIIKDERDMRDAKAAVQKWLQESK
jgi:MoxR-like ATPase